jgi:hypothetical protein
MDISALLLTTYICTLATLILICAPGLIMYNLFENSQMQPKPLTRITTSFVVGFSILVTIFFVAGKFENFVRPILLSFLILSLLSLAVLALNGSLRSLLLEIKTLALASLVGVWQFLPGLNLSNSAGTGMNMVTLNNNDIAFYASAATEFLESGFSPSGHMASASPNFQIAEYGYHSPFALISFIATTFQLSPWQVTTPAIGAVIGMSFLGLSRLSRSFFEELSANKSMAIGAAITMTSFMTYIQSNYFFGQIFALVVCSIFLSSVIDFTKQKQKTSTQYLEACFLIIISIYTYPHFLIAFDVAIFLLFGFLWLRNRNITNSAEALKFAAAIGLGILLSFPNLFSALKTAILISDTEAGWPLPFLNPLNMTIWPSRIGIVTSGYILTLSWITLLSAVLFALTAGKSRSKVNEPAFIFAFLVPVSVAVIIILRNQGFEAYQSWKLTSFTFPIAMAAILPLIISKIKFGEKALWIFLGVTSGTAMTLWGGSPGQLVSKDLVEVSKMERIQSLKSLNISLNPFFETMAAAQIIRGPKVYTNSASYFPAVVDLDSCTLVHVNDTKFSYVEPLNATYGLASSNKGSCSARPPGINLGEIVLFNSNNMTPNGEGWSSPEEWGTWTIGKIATLELFLNLETKRTLKMHLTSNAFLAPKNLSQDVTILVNNTEIGKINFTLASNNKTRIFEISSNLLNNIQEPINIKFLIKNPTSPSSLGSGGDPRELGMGLISIKLD